jgi:CheY-like chemotaxis protein
MNLALNARDAMPRGGQLTVATGRRTLDRAAADAAGLPPGDYARLTLSDTGRGMDEATRARLFEPFYTTKPPGQGTGLGLATVHGIVTQSGGTVRVETAPGRGTTFYVYLPSVVDAPPVAVGGGDGSGDEPGAGRVIRVVDDEPSVRRVAARILAARGYSVLAATDGADALRVLGQHAGPIELLLTDFVMPGLSGQELIARARVVRPDLRVALMSGYPSDPVAAPSADAAGIPFLAKPFTQDSLAAFVGRLLPSAP